MGQLKEVVGTGRGKFIFNSVFFGLLGGYFLFKAIGEILKLLNNSLNPAVNMVNTIQISNGLLTIILLVALELILPLILFVTFVLHIVCFSKCEFGAKAFKREFYINIFLVIVAFFSGILLLWSIMNSVEDAAGIFLFNIYLLWIIGVIVSIVFFFEGFIGYKK